MDPQLVELAGRNWLTSQLLRAGLEVARPERDRGIDLIAYIDTDERRRFRAYPIQMKAATNEAFSIDRKYERFPNLILVYVWNLGDSAQTRCFALTYSNAIQIADKMEFTKTPSWLQGGRYSTTAPSKRLREMLAPFAMSPKRWLEITEQ